MLPFPMMPQDIRNQRLYRQRRKQEMLRLRATLKNLAAKRAFFQEQVDYYNQYVKTCLDNLSTKGKYVRLLKLLILCSPCLNYNTKLLI